jgi:membrane protease YdiL (CAAX protease family)
MLADLHLFDFYVPYILLGLSLLLCWVSKKTAIVFFAAALGTGYWFGNLKHECFLVLPILTAFVLTLRYTSHKSLRFLAHLGFFALAFGLFFHKIPGFDNFKVFDGTQVCSACAPFTMYLNLEGGIIGFLLLTTLIPLARSGKDWAPIFQTASFWLVLCVFALMAAATYIGYVKFDMKFPPQTYVFALNNLILVCIAEEAFFRGYIQKYLTSFCTRYQLPKLLALVIASLLFGFRHLAGGPAFIGLSAIAGLFYGAAYMKTGRIEASIITHFGLNIIHFLFFSYPFLAH